MSSLVQYTVTIVVENEAGEKIERSYRLPAGVRSWALLRGDSTESIIAHLSTAKHRAASKKSVPGWCN